MNFVLAVFRSRTQTQNFARIMRERGMACSVVRTPPEAKVGCGISAKVSYYDLPRAERIVWEYRLTSFNGFYEFARITGRTVVKRIR